MESRRKAVWRLLLALMLGGAAGAPAFGQAYVKRGAPERQGKIWIERDECGAPVEDGGRLVLRADGGAVSVMTGKSGQMQCQVMVRAYTANAEEARRLLGSYRLSVQPMSGGVVIESRTAQSGRRGRQTLAADFSVVVPKRFNLDLETRGGDISVKSPLEGAVRAVTAGGDVALSSMDGRVTVVTAGGNIKLANAGGPVDLRTAGGSIHAGNIGGDATFETSGGDIEAGEIEGVVRAETAGGDIALAGAAQSVNAETSGGQIRIGRTGGSVRAETAGGSILLRGAKGLVNVQTAGGSINLFGLEGAVRAETAAGQILAQLAGTGKTFGPSKLETSSGDVQVYIPSDLPITINAAIASAGGHRIVSDFPLTIQAAGQIFAGRSIRAEGPVNGGGPVLTLRTVGGGIEIRKVDAHTLQELKEREERYWKPGQKSHSSPPASKSNLGGVT